MPTHRTSPHGVPLARPALMLAHTLGRVYRGAGWVLAATQAGQVVHMAYLVDLSADLREALAADWSDTYATAFVRQWWRSPEAQPHVREMQALGQVSVGRCAGRTYCPL